MSAFGQIKSFNYGTGYGFVADVHGMTDLEEDVFVDREELPVEWRRSEIWLEGVDVCFDVKMEEGRARAYNLEPAWKPCGGSIVCVAWSSRLIALEVSASSKSNA
eukprot:GEMP01034626.1.p1 GENE.GEMP01034626.1~~GEMP01034626.1.p1  ORF type:complete len:105 (+),score=10.89 GEMP01034626.1:332-646(+)